MPIIFTAELAYASDNEQAATPFSPVSGSNRP
jgi:hypothetical protein